MFKVIGGPFKFQPFTEYSRHRIPLPKGKCRKVITVLPVRILYAGCYFVGTQRSVQSIIVIELLWYTLDGTVVSSYYSVTECPICVEVLSLKSELIPTF